MLDIPASALVRTGGSALLAVAGVIALVLGRRDRGALSLGVAFTSWGITLAGNNLFEGNAAAGVWWIPVVALLQAIRLAGFVGIFLWWPTPMRARERWTFGVVAGVAALVALVQLAEAALEPGGMAAIAARQTVPVSSDAAFLLVYASARLWLAVLFGLGIILPLRYLATRPEEGALRRRLAWGGVLMASAMAAGRGSFAPGQFPILRIPFGNALELVGIASAVILWLIATRGADGRPARHAALALTFLVFLGLVTDAGLVGQAVEDAAVGVQRSVFAFLLVYGMLRLGFLGRDIQLRTARRGTLGMAALAALFIVAQVAQELLSAEYGLLMGGVVAGALLFAANPIQRALEGLATRSVPVEEPARPARVSSDAARVESAYREAVRLALRDRALSRDERLALARLADVLGLSASRTLELQHEVEAEVERANDRATPTREERG